MFAVYNTKIKDKEAWNLKEILASGAWNELEGGKGGWIEKIIL